MGWNRTVLIISLVFAGCSSSEEEPTDLVSEDPNNENDSDASGTSEPEDTPDVDDPGNDTGGDMPGPNEPGPSIPGPGTPVRFVAIGDAGKGNADQQAVADAIEAKCAADGCDFVVMLGDNIYEDGVSGVTDPQWQAKFETPYQNINLPFYAALGNHDYNDNNLSSSWSQGPIEVAYTDVSDKWTMPSTYYTFTWGDAGFIVLDTNSIFFDDTTNGDQEEWYTTALAEVSNANWTFAIGHHPYLSNGRHGNAGNYDSISVLGQELQNPVSPVNGRHVKNFLENHVCGTVDMYLAGHDHNRQWMDEPNALCGTEMIVNGAAASLTELDESRNNVFFEDYDTEGFFYVQIDGNQLTGQFIDKNGLMNFEKTITK